MWVASAFATGKRINDTLPSWARTRTACPELDSGISRCTRKRRERSRRGVSRAILPRLTTPEPPPTLGGGNEEALSLGGRGSGCGSRQHSRRESESTTHCHPGPAREQPVLNLIQESPGQPTVTEIVDRLGADRVIWGTDMPIVARSWTYQQNLDFIRVHCNELSDADRTAVLGGTMAGLLGVA